MANSDIVGVDDQEINDYATALGKLNSEIASASSLRNVNKITFLSLADLFKLYSSSQYAAFVASKPAVPPRPVLTQTTPQAELSRAILMTACQPDRNVVRNRLVSLSQRQSSESVGNGKHALLTMYRGFSRFMLDDLEGHKLIGQMSRSAQKRLSAKVAFEMLIVSNRKEIM